MSDTPPIIPDEVASFAPAGRDMLRLLGATVKFSDALQGAVDPEAAMRDTFDDVAAGFGAERAILLRPEPGADPPNLILAYKGEITDEQLGAVARGTSAPGISSSIISSVLEKRAPAIVEHPFHRKGPRQTASLGDNYSVIAAPVLDTGHTRVLAVYYFQNQGPSYDRAYRASDLAILTLFSHIVERLFTHQEMVERSDLTRDITLTRDAVIEAVDRQLLQHRVDFYSDNYEKAAETLGLSRSQLYRLLEQYDINTRHKRDQLRKLGEKAAEAAHKVDERKPR